MTPRCLSFGNLTNAGMGFHPNPDLLARLQNASVADFNKIIANLPLKEKVEVVRELQSLLVAEKGAAGRGKRHRRYRAWIDRSERDGHRSADQGNWASLRLSKRQAR